MISEPQTEDIQPDTSLKTIYTVPAFHELCISTENISAWDPLKNVLIRVVPSSSTSSFVKASILGVPLLEDVTYAVHPHGETAVFCQCETHIEVTGNPLSVYVLENRATKLLTFISSVLRNQQLQCTRVLFQKLLEGPSGTFSSLDHDIRDCHSFRTYYGHIMESGACRILVTGRKSSSIAHMLYNLAHQDGNLVSYVELDPSSTLTEFPQAPSSVAFPPGTLGIGTTTSSWGFRCVHKHHRTLKITEPKLVSILADNIDFSLDAPTEQVPPTGRLCYFFGGSHYEDNPILYHHYARLITASLRLQHVQCIQRAYELYTSGRFENAVEIQQLLSRVSCIVHAPEYIFMNTTCFGYTLMQMLNITTFIVSDNPQLVKSILEYKAPELTHIPVVLPVLPLESERSRPHSSTTYASEAHVDLASKRGWEMYFYGPINYITEGLTPSSYRCVELKCPLSSLKLRQLSASSSSEHDTVNGVLCRILNPVHPATILSFRVLAVLSSERDGVQVSCTPLSFFMYVKDVVKISEGPSLNVILHLVGPPCLSLEYLQFPTTYCLLPSCDTLSVFRPS